MLSEMENSDFRILCVSPSLEGKMLFKQTAARIHAISGLSLCDSLLEAEERMYGGGTFQAVYVSSFFQSSVIKDFVKASRNSSGGRSAAYMLVMENDDGMQSREDLEVQVLGLDGTLPCPYSRWSLSKSIEVARVIHEKRYERMQQAEMEILVGKLLSEVDTAAAKQSRHIPAEFEIRKARNISHKIHNLIDELQDDFYAILQEQTEHAEPASQKETINERKQVRVIKKRN